MKIIICLVLSFIQLTYVSLCEEVTVPESFVKIVLQGYKADKYAYLLKYKS